MEPTIQQQIRNQRGNTQWALDIAGCERNITSSSRHTLLEVLFQPRVMYENSSRFRQLMFRIDPKILSSKRSLPAKHLTSRFKFISVQGASAAQGAGEAIGPPESMLLNLRSLTEWIYHLDYSGEIPFGRNIPLPLPGEMRPLVIRETDEIYGETFSHFRSWILSPDCGSWRSNLFPEVAGTHYC